MESFDKKLALLFSAALFTFAHIFNPEISALALVNIFLGGLLLGLNYIYTKTLWFAIGFHFGWNFIQGHVLGFAVSGIPEQPMLTQELNGNPLLTGGQFGFEGSFVATAVLAIAIAVFYYVYETKNAEIIVAN
jgi:hypothetical protein